MHSRAPLPDLRIIPVDSAQAHEEHDNQRAIPLIERLQNETHLINPPLVTTMDDDRYVILDGANRFHTFAHLKYPHILVQVISYDSDYIELSTWQHMVSEWEIKAFMRELEQLPGIKIRQGNGDKTKDNNAIVHLLLREEHMLSINSSIDNIHKRNAALRQIVHIYQSNARLYRTSITEPQDIWPLYQDAIALVLFPDYQPADIIAAAKHRAYLPASVSRHIVHGRALRVNYPLDALRDPDTSLEDKNKALQKWMQQKLSQRQIRYYAEATYLFDE